MARYEEMDELLDRVRRRLVDRPQSAENQESEPTRLFDVVPRDDRFDQIMACTQMLMASAESLRELLASDTEGALTSEQQKHILSVLNSVLQELWSSEVSLRRAALSD
jgi:hypothetical protein